jgi:hypothetical protein
LFFFGAVSAELSWQDLSSSGRHQLAHYLNVARKIEIDYEYCGFYVKPEDYDTRSIIRLSVILHEAVHAFLRQLVCHSCRTYDNNVDNAGGHGRAFQVLLVALVDANYRLLGLPLRIGASNDSTVSWQKVRYLPSMHDVEQWRWLTGEVF